MSLTDMIVKPSAFGVDEDGSTASWTVNRGSRRFLVLRSSRGDWNTFDLHGMAEVVLDVSGDLSGSLEYIESLFH